MAARLTRPKGRKDKQVRDQILVALHRYEIGPDGKRVKRLAIMCDALVRLACEGDIAAIKEVADRVDGKAVPRLDLDDGRGEIIISWIGETGEPTNQLTGPDAFADVRSQPLVIRG
jgi:hypothetical protein